jgi:hypothetical protein
MVIPAEKGGFEGVVESCRRAASWRLSRSFSFSSDAWTLLN